MFTKKNLWLNNGDKWDSIGTGKGPRRRKLLKGDSALTCTGPEIWFSHWHSKDSVICGQVRSSFQSTSSRVEVVCNLLILWGHHGVQLECQPHPSGDCSHLRLISCPSVPNYSRRHPRVTGAGVSDLIASLPSLLARTLTIIGGLFRKLLSWGQSLGELAWSL